MFKRIAQEVLDRGALTEERSLAVPTHIYGGPSSLPYEELDPSNYQRRLICIKNHMTNLGQDIGRFRRKKLRISGELGECS
jgi:hypothetical protein